MPKNTTNDIINANAVFPEKTIVLVTNQFNCERIIRAGRRIADISKTDLLVLNVQDSHYSPNPQALQHLFNVSKENGAIMQVSYSKTPAKAIIPFIKRYKTQNVLTGLPSSKNSVLQKLWNKFMHIRFFVVDPDGIAQEVANLQAEFSENAVVGAVGQAENQQKG